MVLRACPEIKHLAMSQYNLRIEPLLRNLPGLRFRVAAVVREPLSWLGSWYRYRQRPQTAGQSNSTLGISFERFIQDYLSDPRPPYAALGRQSGFLSPPGGMTLAPETAAWLRETLAEDYALWESAARPTP